MTRIYYLVKYTFASINIDYIIIPSNPFSTVI